MTSLVRLFLRDLRYHWKGLASLTAAACLICAVLTGAFLIGDSVRGTLMDNVSANAAFARYRQRLPIPISSPIRNGLGVLHVKGFLADGIPVDVYALPDSGITGRDARGSRTLARKLYLQNGEMLSIRVPEMSTIPAESAMGKPPELKQMPFVWRGEWTGPESELNFDDPQLPPHNLFVSREALTQALDLPGNAVNEVWMQEPEVPSDDLLWELSGLTMDEWDGRPVLKCRSDFLPKAVSDALPTDATPILTLFVETLSDGKTSLSYCFAGAIRGDPVPVGRGHVLVSSGMKERFDGPLELSYFTSGPFRTIQRKTTGFEHAGTVDDSTITDVLSPEIPGLTDSDDCSGWEAAIPIDFGRIRDEDEAYWNEYRSKPKLYLNFEEAQEMFAPGLCTAALFPADWTADRVRLETLKTLRAMPEYSRVDDLMNQTEDKVNRGVPFAPLFLGLSFFLIVSGLLVLAMLLKLHIQDRAAELALLTDYMPLKRVRRFLLAEFAAVLVPGMLAGLAAGTILCRIQIFLLEHSWNGIVLMEHIRFHGRPVSCFTAFIISAVCAWAVVMLSVRRTSSNQIKLVLPHSSCVRPVWRIGMLSFVRLCRQYSLCAALLVLGYLGTLGVGAFGIKSRGEDAFGYAYVATTLLPVVPDYDAPFPAGGLPVRVHAADRADCSNLLLAANPTVYGADLKALTGDPDFLADGSAAVDKGSLVWIMQKKKHDSVEYANGSLTLDRVLKASVFQGGILTGLDTFERLFPDTEGALFFLIRSEADVPAWREYLEPFGLELCSAGEFMNRAERFQNRYLAIFLQLGLLGALLGFGALVLLMMRNLRAREAETALLAETGWSRGMLAMLYLAENMCLFLGSAGVSLLLLLLLAAFASLNLAVLLGGFVFLTAAGVLMIAGMIELYFLPCNGVCLKRFYLKSLCYGNTCFRYEQRSNSHRIPHKKARDPPR